MTAKPMHTFDDARPDTPAGYEWPLWPAMKGETEKPCEWCGRLTAWTVRYGVACCSYLHLFEDER